MSTPTEPGSGEPDPWAAPPAEQGAQAPPAYGQQPPPPPPPFTGTKKLAQPVKAGDTTATIITTHHRIVPARAVINTILLPLSSQQILPSKG